MALLENIEVTQALTWAARHDGSKTGPKILGVVLPMKEYK